MPFVEVLGFETDEGRRERLSAELTGALATAFGIQPEIISIYHLGFAPEYYAHAGQQRPPLEGRRVFIKVHAFRRDEGRRRAAAQAMTRAVAESCPVEPDNVAIYFLDREPAEVAHGGILASDH